MKEFLTDYTNWSTHVLTDWFTFFGQLAVCYALHYFIIYLLKEKGIKPPKTISVILGWVIAIIIFYPVMNI